MTDVIEASSISHMPQLIDIYSASWGPTDDGKTVDGPRELTLQAMADGVNKVRRQQIFGFYFCFFFCFNIWQNNCNISLVHVSSRKFSSN